MGFWFVVCMGLGIVAVSEGEGMHPSFYSVVRMEGEEESEDEQVTSLTVQTRGVFRCYISINLSSYHKNRSVLLPRTFNGYSSSIYICNHIIVHIIHFPSQIHSNPSVRPWGICNITRVTKKAKAIQQKQQKRVQKGTAEHVPSFSKR